MPQFDQMLKRKPRTTEAGAPACWRLMRFEWSKPAICRRSGLSAFRALELFGLAIQAVTVQVVGRASRLPDRTSCPRWCDRGRDAPMAGETPAPLPEKLLQALP